MPSTTEERATVRAACYVPTIVHGASKNGQCRRQRVFIFYVAQIEARPPDGPLVIAAGNRPNQIWSVNENGPLPPGGPQTRAGPRRNTTLQFGTKGLRWPFSERAP